MSQRTTRLRLGVGAREPGLAIEGGELRDYVLDPFAADELESVDAMIRRGADACECWLAEGIDAAMSRFNG